MNLNTNDRYLSLVIDSLEAVIKPELSSGHANATIDIAITTLKSLLQREHGDKTKLLDTITAGQLIAEEIAEVLGQDIEKASPALHFQMSFDYLAQQHAALNEEVTSLCEQLCEQDNSERPALLRKAAEWEYSYYGTATSPVALPTTRSPGEPLSAESFERFLCRNNKNCQTVETFTTLSGGFGKQTYLAKVRGATGSQELIVRKTDPTPIMNHGACRLENEHALLEVLATQNYLAPKPLEFCAEWENVDGCFYTMERTVGTVPATFLEGAQASIPEATLLELAELLAELHNIPLTTFQDYANQYDDPTILDGDISQCYQLNLAGWQRYVRDENHLPSPLVVWLMDWLEHNIPRDNRPPVLVHGDFNVHNLLVDQGRVTAVLDWECAGFGAPEQDLAYIQPHVSQHIDWQRFVDFYVASGGQAPRAEMMRYGMAYAALRTNLAGIRGTSNLQRGVNRDIRYAMVELGFTPTFMGLALDHAQ